MGTMQVVTALPFGWDADELRRCQVSLAGCSADPMLDLADPVRATVPTVPTDPQVNLTLTVR